MKKPLLWCNYKRKGPLFVCNGLFIHSFIIHSIGLSRIQRFLAVLRSFFHSCYVLFPATLPHQLFFHPFSLHLAIYFLVYLSILLFPNSYIRLFWEFYFLPFSVHVQTNVIYLNLIVSIIVGF